MVVAVFMMLFGVAIGGVAVVAAYARTQVLPPQTFADRVVTSLSDADVQAVVSGKLDAIVKERVGAAANTASVKAAVNRVIASPAIRQIAREQAQVAQQRVTEGTADDFTVDLAAALPLLVAQLQTVDPARAAALRTITGAIPVTWEPPAAAVTVRRTVDAIQFVGITAPVLAALLLFIAFVIAPKRQLLLALTGVLVAAVLGDVVSATSYAVAAVPTFLLNARYSRAFEVEADTFGFALLDKAGIPYTAAVLVGPVAETIVDYAQKNGCEKIVMGTRGLGALGSVLLGSVTSRLMSLTDLPVTLVK